MGERDIPDDYISAAAAVVEAARRADEARRQTEDARAAYFAAMTAQNAAEKELSEALDNLKQAGTGRA